MGVLLLVVEDEPLILLSVQDALEAGGYTVLTAAHGAEAIQVLDNRSGEISGLLTDIKLGTGPDGWQLRGMHEN